MINYLNHHEREDIPQWLLDYTPGCELDYDSIFASRCVYYPGAGSDGMPVKICNMAHCAHLYIYSDYLYGDSAFYPDSAKVMVRDYDIIDRRTLLDFSSIDWMPHVDPSLLVAGAPETAIIKYDPVFELLVYERQAHRTEEFGATRFAVMFCTYDGIALYDILFGNKIFKNLFLILLQDHGLGGNYSSFRGLMQQIALNSNIFPKYCIAQYYGSQSPLEGVWEGYSLLRGCNFSRSYPSCRTRTLYIKDTARSRWAR